MRILLILTLMLSFSAIASDDVWESEFPDNVNTFIYDEVHYQCALADYVDGIIAIETVDFPLGKTYIPDFSMYGDIAQGYIAVDVTFEGDLHLKELECPRP